MDRQTLSSFFLVALIVAIAYVWFQYAREAPIQVEEPIEASPVLIDLRRINDVRLDISVFQDPVFQVLAPIPLITDAPLANPGRENPFRPF